MDPVVAIAIIAFFGFIAYRIYVGPRGVLFPSGVESTLGTVQVSNSTYDKLNLDVHRLRSSGDKRWIGIQFNTRRGTSWHFMPLSLNRDEALALSELLRKAAE